MITYTKKAEGRHGWVVQVNYDAGGIDPATPILFATEAEADAWIAQHKKRNGEDDTP